MNIVKVIKELREKKNISMDEMAKKLGITRQTYAKLEKNEASLSTKQLETISAFFGVPIEEFFYGIQDVDKFKEMYLYVLSQFKDTGIPKTKLAKLLYLIDFSHYYNNLESMSGVLYKCKEYGPLADPFLELTDGMYDTGMINIDSLSHGAQMIMLNQNSNLEFSLLKDDDKKEISAICEKWRNANTQTIVNYTHHQKPWKACRKDEVIPYELILQEEPNNVY